MMRLYRKADTLPSILVLCICEVVFAVYYFVPGFAETAMPQLGYGCAMSLLTTILFAFISLGYNKFSHKMKNIY